MLIMAREKDYSELLESLRGHRVSIWTCNTCARMCYGIGGKQSAEQLSERLTADGVDVAGVSYTSAACLETKVLDKKEEVLDSGSDVVLALMCSVGAGCAERIFRKEVINPVRTYGFGYLSADGDPILILEGGEMKLKEVSQKASPFV